MNKTAVAFFVALSLAAVGPAAPALGLAPSACRVKNVDTGVTKRNLQAAVKAARNGHHLTVRGRCHGTTKIAKSLTITGIRPKGAGAPTLDGDQNGSVVKIYYGRTVLLERLKITDGSGSAGSGEARGGGILNSGDLTLSNVRVIGNNAASGGGIMHGAGNKGSELILRGATRILGNSATDGGGIYGRDSVFVRASSQIRGNTATRAGGGVYISTNHDRATIVIKGAAQIVDNTAGTDGGGIFNGFRIVVVAGGSSRISGNTAGTDGGGIYNQRRVLLKGSSQVNGNTAAGRGGGVYSGRRLGLAASSRIVGNTASLGGGVFSDGTFDMGNCGPGKPVHGNTVDDCAGS